MDLSSYLEVRAIAHSVFTLISLLKNVSNGFYAIKL